MWAIIPATINHCERIPTRYAVSWFVNGASQQLRAIAAPLNAARKAWCSALQAVHLLLLAACAVVLLARGSAPELPLDWSIVAVGSFSVLMLG